MMKLQTHHNEIHGKIPQTADGKHRGMISEVFVGHGGATISSVMSKDVVTMDHTKTVHDAYSVMAKKRIGYVIITAYSKPFGIVTERDLVHLMANMNISSKCLLLSFLASRPLICARPSQTMQEAAGIMAKHNIDHLPIMDGDLIVGIVTTRDIALSLLETRA